jgi:hypothetical protein
VPHPTGEALALIDRDLSCYLMAQAARRGGWTLDLPSHPIHLLATELLQRAQRHLHNLNQPRRGLDLRKLLNTGPMSQPTALAAKSNTWMSRFPNFFRNFS